MLLQLLLAQAPVGSLPLSCSRIGTLRLPRMPFGSNDLLLFKLSKRHDEMLCFESSAVGLKGPVEDPPSGSKKDLVEEPLRELCFREQSGHWRGCESLHSAIY